ncbi:MAG TPA: tetratricopeptide repeat protein [Thermoanaerobaculia bacterium]|nr:tetratricopeptide repeat protein [Thermoanaerobaculia bacterium]
MSHPSAERLLTFLRGLTLKEAALVSHLLCCERCSARAAGTLGLAPIPRSGRVQEAAPPDRERYGRLFDRLESTVVGAQEALARDRAEAGALLKDLLRTRGKQARLERLHADSRFQSPALAEALLAEPADDPEQRRDLVQLAIAVLDFEPEPVGAATRRASLRAAAHIALGDVLRTLGDLDGAEAVLQFAPEWIERTGDVLDAANFCRALGALRRDQNRRDEAIALLTRAVDLYEEIGQSDAEARTRVELGELCLQTGEPGRALDAFLGALRLGPPDLAAGLAARAAKGTADSPRRRNPGQKPGSGTLSPKARSKDS